MRIIWRRGRHWGIDRAAGALLWMLAGCSSTAPSSGTDAAADATTDQRCNAIELTGSAITPTCVTGSLPVGSGGTIVDGTYDVTAQTYYNLDTGCPDFQVRETWVLSGNSLEAASLNPLPITRSGTFAVAGDTFKVTTTCIHLDQEGQTLTTVASNGTTYSATPTSITLFTDDSGDAGANLGVAKTLTRR